MRQIPAGMGNKKIILSQNSILEYTLTKTAFPLKKTHTDFHSPKRPPHQNSSFEDLEQNLQYLLYLRPQSKQLRHKTTQVIRTKKYNIQTMLVSQSGPKSPISASIPALPFNSYETQILSQRKILLTTDCKFKTRQTSLEKTIYFNCIGLRNALQHTVNFSDRSMKTKSLSH